MKNWKQKLTSRKFWAAVAGFLTPLLVTFGVTENAAAEIVSIVMSGAVLIAYIIGEGLVDSAAAESQVQSTALVEKTEEDQNADT